MDSPLQEARDRPGAAHLPRILRPFEGLALLLHFLRSSERLAKTFAAVRGEYDLRRRELGEGDFCGGGGVTGNNLGQSMHKNPPALQVIRRQSPTAKGS